MAFCVAVTWPLYERRVERFMAQFGIEHYLPRWKTQAPKPRTVLMFPRYIFAARDDWRRVREVPGVSKLLKSGGELPAEVPDEDIERLRAREAEGVVKLKRRPKMRIGQKVRIISGPLAGQKATYAGEARRGREHVEVGLRRVELPTDNLVAE